jgi:hypothetical protein
LKLVQLISKLGEAIAIKTAILLIDEAVYLLTTLETES